MATQSKEDDRDLAHEAYLRRLRREQLRGEDFSHEEVSIPSDEWDYDVDTEPTSE